MKLLSTTLAALALGLFAMPLSADAMQVFKCTKNGKPISVQEAAQACKKCGSKVTAPTVVKPATVPKVSAPTVSRPKARWQAR
jgi:DNA-directed RNA polymerase subunit RPC12/RpoP